MTCATLVPTVPFAFKGTTYAVDTAAYAKGETRSRPKYYSCHGIESIPDVTTATENTKNRNTVAEGRPTYGRKKKPHIHTPASSDVTFAGIDDSMDLCFLATPYLKNFAPNHIGPNNLQKKILKIYYEDKIPTAVIAANTSVAVTARKRTVLLFSYLIFVLNNFLFF